MAQLYGDIIRQIAQNAGIDPSAFSDGLYSTMLRAIAESGSGTVIIAEENTSVNGYQVPLLTEEQVILAYNCVISGRNCVIADKDEKMHFVVNQADVVGDSVQICIQYFDVMILCYSDDGTIEFTEI